MNIPGMVLTSPRQPIADDVESSNTDPDVFNADDLNGGGARGSKLPYRSSDFVRFFHLFSEINASLRILPVRYQCPVLSVRARSLNTFQ
jgi:hypothetical protein